MRQTMYEQFIEEMELNGFRKVHSKIDEIYAKLSDDDNIISISALDCHMVTIKGIRESKSGDGYDTLPHRIFMKIYSEDGKELESGDTIQFSIVSIERTGLPTVDPGKHCCIYYHYPYRAISSERGITLKKGIAIIKDKRLEFKMFRRSELLKIWKFEMSLECDKWFKIDEKREKKLALMYDQL